MKRKKIGVYFLEIDKRFKARARDSSALLESTSLFDFKRSFARFNEASARCLSIFLDASIVSTSSSTLLPEISANPPLVA